MEFREVFEFGTLVVMIISSFMLGYMTKRDRKPEKEGAFEVYKEFMWSCFYAGVDVNKLAKAMHKVRHIIADTKKEQELDDIAEGYAGALNDHLAKLKEEGCDIDLDNVIKEAHEQKEKHKI